MGDVPQSAVPVVDACELRGDRSGTRYALSRNRQHATLQLLGVWVQARRRVAGLARAQGEVTGDRGGEAITYRDHGQEKLAEFDKSYNLRGWTIGRLSL